jgi:hypothetical protein
VFLGYQGAQIFAPNIDKDNHRIQDAHVVGGNDVAALGRYIIEVNRFNACQQPDEHGKDRGYHVSQHGLFSQALIVAPNTKNLKSSGHFLLPFTQMIKKMEHYQRT